MKEQEDVLLDFESGSYEDMIKVIENFSKRAESILINIKEKENALRVESDLLTKKNVSENLSMIADTYIAHS